MDRIKNNFKPGDPPYWTSQEMNVLATFYNELDLLFGEVVKSPAGQVTLNPYMLTNGSGGGVGSFAFKSSKDDYLMFYGGAVKWSGRPSFLFDDGEENEGVYSGVYVQVAGGSINNPHAVQIRIDSGIGPTSAVLICGLEQDDGGGFFYRTLGTAYLEDGEAKFLLDRRNDWQVIGI